MQSERVFRFGIIGCGVAGTRHAAVLAQMPSIKVVAVSAHHKKNAQILANKYLGVRVTNTEDLINANDIDVVCICSPNYLHGVQTIEAMQTGKHVIVEKPLTLELREARLINQISSVKNLSVICVFPRRFDTTWKELIRLFDEKILSGLSMTTVEINYYRPSDYYQQSSWHGRKKLDGGIVVTQAIHYLDLLCQLISSDKRNQEKQLVVSRLKVLSKKINRKLEISDTVYALFQIEDVVCNLSVSTSAYPGRPARITLICSQGTIEITNESISYWGVRDIPEIISSSNGWQEQAVRPVFEAMIDSLNK